MARISGNPNGPLSLEGEAELRRPSGPNLSKQKVALCRCGGSKNKPFCDGTHAKIGFSDRNLSDPKKDQRVSYAGRKITIFDNRALCAHAGYCTDGLKEVFRYGEEPWIAPDAATVEKVIETIRKCPSGALSYALDGVEAAAKVGQGASAEHYTLCRCGHSKNKPFCDGTHWDVSFRDP
jgi:CDGSH-type Zn-finger protein